MIRAALVFLAMLSALQVAHPQTPSEPFPVRGVLPWHNFLSGPSAWNLADYKAYLDDCSSRGINLVAFHNYTGGGQRYATYVEPMVRIEHKGILPEAFFDNSMTARWGYAPRPISAFAFGTAQCFGADTGAFGADCATRAVDNADRYRRAQDLLCSVMAMAHDRGMRTAMGFEFGVHPPEFFSIMEPGSYWEGTGSMIPNPAHAQSIEILYATIDNIIAAYPGVDYIWLWLNEHSFFGFDPDQALRDPGFKSLFDSDAKFFDAPGTGIRQQLTGVWALAYLRLAYGHMRRVAPDKHMVIGGWGGSDQLPPILRGLDAALPVDVVFSCLNPGMGDYPQPAFMTSIAAHRKFWSIPWLEGDHALWHAQPRVSVMRDQVKQASAQRHDGVIAIHWRTEETKPAFEAFARFAANPGDTASVQTVYRAFLRKECGETAATELSPLFAEADVEGWFRAASSPEYYPYTPAWGRLDTLMRARLIRFMKYVQDVSRRTSTPAHRQKLEWYAADCRFMLLLDDVGRKLEPAARLRARLHSSGGSRDALSPADIRAAQQDLRDAPVGELFAVYASRIRSRGELGVLSSLNQKLYNEYTHLLQFLSSL